MKAPTVLGMPFTFPLAVCLYGLPFTRMALSWRWYLGQWMTAVGISEAGELLE